MFAQERQSEIMTLLGAQKSVAVQELAARFHVTEETIRRDLNLLERQGLLLRTHGGAMLPDDALTETPLGIREGINPAGKNAIGAAAARMVSDGDTVILDASTSALYVARHLKQRRSLTVITNAERVIFELADCTDLNLICTGGVLRHKSRSYTGRAAENLIGSYSAGFLFFSCKGFSLGSGLTDSNEQESEIRKVMLTRARRRIFLCDYTKYDRVGFAATATLDDIDCIITDRPLPDGLPPAVQASGVTHILASSL